VSYRVVYFFPSQCQLFDFAINFKGPICYIVLNVSLNPKRSVSSIISDCCTLVLNVGDVCYLTFFGGSVMSAQHTRSTGLPCGRLVTLEISIRPLQRSRSWQGQLQTSAKDTFIYTVLKNLAYWRCFRLYTVLPVDFLTSLLTYYAVDRHGSEPELSHWKTDPNNAEHGFPSAAGEDFCHSSDKAHPTVSAAALTSIATCAAGEGVRPENGTKSLGERIRTSTGPTDDPLTEDGVLRTASTDPESSSKLETPRSDLSVRSLTEVPAISDKSTSGAHYPSEKPGSTDFHKVKNEDAENPANATAVPASSRTPTVIQPVPSTSSATADSRVRNGTSVVGDVDLPSVDSNTSPLSESFQPSETVSARYYFMFYL